MSLCPPRALALSLGLSAAALAPGCDADCRDQKRMDGTWEVWSNVSGSADEVTGDNVEAYPFDSVGLINGWSTWTLTYVPSNSTFQMEIDGQPFTGSYTESADNCNAFGLAFTGTYDTDVDTAHTLSWTGELVYMGDHLGGTWSYEDSWVGGGASGTLVVPAGELNANIEGSAGDFSDTGA
jgi:hypothetical protein